MRVSDLMKGNPVCVSSHETARAAARKMRDENVGFLPVCDRSSRVIGTITDRDIAIRLVAEGRDSDLPVGDVMSREVVACRAEDDLTRVESLMSSNHKSRIVVIDDQGKLQGVVSLSDIAEVDEPHAASTLAKVSEREFHHPH